MKKKFRDKNLKMLKNVKKDITLKIEGLPPLVYRTKLMHFLETKLTLSSHT